MTNQANNRYTYVTGITVTRDTNTNTNESVCVYRDNETGGIFGIDSSVYESTTEVLNPFTGESIDFDNESLFEPDKGLSNRPKPEAKSEPKTHQDFFIQLMVRDGELEHNHRLMSSYDPSKMTLDTAAHYYAANFWGKPDEYDKSGGHWWIHGYQRTIQIEKYNDLSEVEAKTLRRFIY